MAPVTTRAVLLRAHDYGETSRILRFYTADHGLLSVMARGVRGASGKSGTGLNSFASGDLTAYVRPHRDLHTMKDFYCVSLRGDIGGDMLRFAGASAVAELILNHTEQESHPGLLDALEATLDELAAGVGPALATTCVAGLWHVVDVLGFSPELDMCVLCGEILGPEDVGRFDLPAGGVRCQSCGEGASGPRVGPGARLQIRQMLEGRTDPPVTHVRRHLTLLSDFISYHVATRPLKSLDFLGSLIPAEEDAR